jgi:hypothetical protein
LISSWDANNTNHIGPDASLVNVIPEGASWAGLDEHLVTVAHEESFVAEGQWVGTENTLAWVGVGLLSADTVSETIADNADVGQSSTDVERLAEAIESLTTWLLGLADGGVQFASFAGEAWGTLALVWVFSLEALTTVQTWLRSTNVFVDGDFAFASAGLSSPEEILGAGDFVTLAVIGADDVFLSLAEGKDGFGALTLASNVGVGQWECWSEGLNHGWEASFGTEWWSVVGCQRLCAWNIEELLHAWSIEDLLCVPIRVWCWRQVNFGFHQRLARERTVGWSTQSWARQNEQTNQRNQSHNGSTYEW